MGTGQGALITQGSILRSPTGLISTEALTLTATACQPPERDRAGFKGLPGQRCTTENSARHAVFRWS